jgi:hypothetical protein
MMGYYALPVRKATSPPAFISLSQLCFAGGDAATAWPAAAADRQRIPTPRTHANALVALQWMRGNKGPASKPMGFRGLSRAQSIKQSA